MKTTPVTAFSYLSKNLKSGYLFVTLWHNELNVLTMITQYQATSLLKQEIPGLSTVNLPTRVSLEIYSSMNYFSDYTKHTLVDHDFPQAKKCLFLADKLYRNGDNIVRMLIENSFIYSIISVMSLDPAERHWVKSIIPASLYSIYLKQVTASGC
jgi:hypothetical protein